MLGTAYTQRRGEIQTYFDRTAVDAWKRFATEAPLGRIRASVREGRARMRGVILAGLPLDLSGWRILDAGCGAGALSFELARRGAEVVGIDLAPEIVRFAGDTRPANLAPGSVSFLAGDMLSPQLGEFDAVVAMDSIIHYGMADAVSALQALASRSRRKLIFTFAPWTAPLAAMHAAGRLFPRRDRAPSIVPVRPGQMRALLSARLAGHGWQVVATQRVSHGFYKSQAMELVRA